MSLAELQLLNRYLEANLHVSRGNAVTTKRARAKTINEMEAHKSSDASNTQLVFPCSGEKTVGKLPALSIHHFQR